MRSSKLFQFYLKYNYHCHLCRQDVSGVEMVVVTSVVAHLC